MALGMLGNIGTGLGGFMQGYNQTTDAQLKADMMRRAIADAQRQAQARSAAGLALLGGALGNQGSGFPAGNAPPVPGAGTSTQTPALTPAAPGADPSPRSYGTAPLPAQGDTWAGMSPLPGYISTGLGGGQQQPTIAPPTPTGQYAPGLGSGNTAPTSGGQYMGNVQPPQSSFDLPNPMRSLQGGQIAGGPSAAPEASTGEEPPASTDTPHPAANPPPAAPAIATGQGPGTADEHADIKQYLSSFLHTTSPADLAAAVHKAAPNADPETVFGAVQELYKMSVQGSNVERAQTATLLGYLYKNDMLDLSKQRLGETTRKDLAGEDLRRKQFQDKQDEEKKRDARGDRRLDQTDRARDQADQRMADQRAAAAARSGNQGVAAQVRALNAERRKIVDESTVAGIRTAEQTARIQQIDQQVVDALKKAAGGGQQPQQ